MLLGTYDINGGTYRAESTVTLRPVRHIEIVVHRRNTDTYRVSGTP